jgi:hypothetical protein
MSNTDAIADTGYELQATCQDLLPACVITTSWPTVPVPPSLTLAAFATQAYVRDLEPSSTSTSPPQRSRSPAPTGPTGWRSVATSPPPRRVDAPGRTTSGASPARARPTWTASSSSPRARSLAGRRWTLRFATGATTLEPESQAEVPASLAASASRAAVEPMFKALAVRGDFWSGDMADSTLMRMLC